MYSFAAFDGIFGSISNIYLISSATVFLAVIIALYFANFLKDEEVEENVDEGIDWSDTTDLENEDTTGIGSLQAELQRRLLATDDEEEIELEFAIDNDGDMADDEQDIDEAYVDDDELEDYNNDNDDLNAINCCNDDEASRAEAQKFLNQMRINRLRELEAQLTRDQLEEERRVEREQLATIFELLKKQEAELKMREIDEQELKAQMKLYR